MKTSDLYSLDLKDIAKGITVAIGGAVVATLEATLQAGSLTFNWKNIGLTALAAGLSYLGKNFFTTSSIVNPVNKF